MSQFRGEVALLASCNDNGAMTNTHRKKNSTDGTIRPGDPKDVQSRPQDRPVGAFRFECRHL